MGDVLSDLSANPMELSLLGVQGQPALANNTITTPLLTQLPRMCSTLRYFTLARAVSSYVPCSRHVCVSRACLYVNAA